MKKGKTIFMKDTIELLQDLLEQHQFELLIPENENTDRLRLAYLMNDAVESFLVFVNAGITGLYQKDYEGELDYSLSREGQGYVLSVWQGKNVVTLFFRKLELEVHLYDISGSWSTGLPLSGISWSIWEKNSAQRKKSVWHIWPTSLL